MLEGDLADLIDRRWEARLFEKDGNVRVAALVFHRDGEPVGDFRKAWALVFSEFCHSNRFRAFGVLGERLLLQFANRLGVVLLQALKLAFERTERVPATLREAGLQMPFRLDRAVLLAPDLRDLFLTVRERLRRGCVVSEALLRLLTAVETPTPLAKRSRGPLTVLLGHLVSRLDPMALPFVVHVLDLRDGHACQAEYEQHREDQVLHGLPPCQRGVHGLPVWRSMQAEKLNRCSWVP